jgi:hypothetical protein
MDRKYVLLVTLLCSLWTGCNCLVHPAWQLVQEEQTPKPDTPMRILVALKQSNLDVLEVSK